MLACSSSSSGNGSVKPLQDADDRPSASEGEEMEPRLENLESAWDAIDQAALQVEAWGRAAAAVVSWGCSFRNARSLG